MHEHSPPVPTIETHDIQQYHPGSDNRRDYQKITKNEGRFLQLLCAKNHEIADKSYLIIGTWGKADKNKEPEVKKYISRLRGYLKADPSLQIDHEGDGYILICLAD